MLQRVKSQRADGRSLGRTDDAENAALFAQLVAVLIKEGMGKVHLSRKWVANRALPMAMLQSDYKGNQHRKAASVEARRGKAAQL